MAGGNPVDICAVCAWRATCQKKFSVSGRDMRCPDFTKDLSIGEKKGSGDAGTAGEEER
jgi:hypothetical protein